MYLFLHRLERVLYRITSISGWVAAVSMAALILLVFGNMAARYLMGFGAVWLQELEWYILSLSVMTAIAYAMRADEHVRVDIFSSRLNRKGRMWLDMLTMTLVAVPVAILVLYYTWPFVQTSYVRGERSPNAGGMPWTFLPKAMILLGFFLILSESIRKIISVGRRLSFHYRRPANPPRNRNHAA
ncbi:TRAP-type mannitol/chloroaromatic compound transport system, small permease component [Ectothiorhodosinus mongolicus]|uniref:TRAP transporter small permease protein n=2 Tax=Ectothiorhodosinus mongolicus TaxID=233100 RepID=A0A1R3W1C0_9GAMM|nr:C4-dicarboxylate ABC transporter permease [Ectothiorhodosinus mongolicus]SIT70274.1 TRAP-type mannitol/chloroaromatic compound transport system, small permease component [Ectothiorhodosinus mongolicus]